MQQQPDSNIVKGKENNTIFEGLLYYVGQILITQNLSEKSPLIGVCIAIRHFVHCQNAFSPPYSVGIDE